MDGSRKDALSSSAFGCSLLLLHLDVAAVVVSLNGRDVYRSAVLRCEPPSAVEETEKNGCLRGVWDERIELQVRSTPSIDADGAAFRTFGQWWSCNTWEDLLAFPRITQTGIAIA